MASEGTGGTDGTDGSDAAPLAPEERVFALSPPSRRPADAIRSAVDRLERELREYDNEPMPSPSRPSSALSGHSFRSSGSAASDSGGRGRRGNADLTSPAYRVPLERGWRRELVYRANLDQNLRRQADVYYYSPKGKKLRSTREVSEHLDGTDLTSDNFTFTKEPLGVDDPDKETIRGAKVIKNRSDSPHREADGLSPNASEGKRTPKPKGPKGSSPDRTGKQLKIKSVGSRLSVASSGSVGSPAKSPSPANSKPPLRKSLSGGDGTRKSILDLDDSADDDDDDMAYDVPEKLPLLPISEKSFFSLDTEQSRHVPPRIFPTSSADVPKHVSPQAKKYVPPPATPSAGRDMCPMRCPLADKEPPTLQCSLCLCLYHSRCTGFVPLNNTSYVCKNCHFANSPSSPPPPESPTPPAAGSRPTFKQSSALSGSLRLSKTSAPATKVPQPRLVPVVRQRIPGDRPSKYPKPDFKPTPVFPKFGSNLDIKLERSPLNPWPAGNSQTTSLPPPPSETNSSQGYRAKTEIDPSIYPQSIAIVNGHKFIVVPKPIPVAAAPLAGQPNNPRQADNAPRLTEGDYGTAGLSYKPWPVDDSKDDIKMQFKSFPKSDARVPQTNVISFDNLTAEYGKFLSKTDAPFFGFEQKNMKRSFSFDVSDDATTLKRKSKGPTPKIIPKIAKKTENGTAGGQKTGRGKISEPKKNYFAEFYKANNESGYNSLVQIFQYLKMRELAAAARVCRMWREIADTPALWRSVRMKNSQVNDWEGLAAALKRHNTCHLDLRKMLHNHPPEAADKTWDQFIEHVSKVDTLLRLDLCRCPASVVERVCERMPQLQALTATSVRCENLNPTPLERLKNLQELRIKGMTVSGLTLTQDLKCLESLTQLKHLSITSVKDIGQCGCIAIKSLTNLESLELGDCISDIGGDDLLSPLTKLTRLRLERCPGANGGAVLLSAASALPELRQLELINVDIKPGFEEALGKCGNVKRLLIIPTYISQSATTNRCVLEGVFKLRSTLTHLVWGVTLELLRVTELFIDQCDKNQNQSAAGGDNKQSSNVPPMSPKSKANGTGDCIPVLKPIPGMPTEETKPPAMAGRPQVEILPLSALQRLLVIELPNTRLKLLRIPYHHTWRQTFNDFD